MRYILIATQVYAGGTLTNTTGIPEPNRLGLFVLGREGWVPWPAVEGETNCTNPNVCPILSFPSWGEAWNKVDELGVGEVLSVDTEHPSEEPLYGVWPAPHIDEDEEPLVELLHQDHG